VRKGGYTVAGRVVMKKHGDCRNYRGIKMEKAKTNMGDNGNRASIREQLVEGTLMGGLR
jgi:hypothetical protein